MKLRYSEIKDDIDIDQVEAAIGFSPLYTDRGNDVGHCIWPENHSNGDTTGKFAIHRDKKVYNCWVCGGGSLLSLVMERFELDVDQATEWLAEFTHGQAGWTDHEYADYLLSMLEDIDERVDTMPYFNPRVLERFDGGLDYFRSRGIMDEISLLYNLRFSEMVMKPAPKKNRGEEVVKIDDDYYGPAAILPHYWQGRLVGWQHRWLAWNEDHSATPRWLAKYTNTTDFPKDNTVYNYDAALRATQPVVVCESVATVLFLLSHGVPAISYFGGNIDPAQLRLIRRLSQGVILAPDNDKVGGTLVNTATKYLERFIPVYVAEPVDLGPKADLGDYAQVGNPSEALHDHLTNRVHRPKTKI